MSIGAHMLDTIKWLAEQLASDPNVDPAIAEFFVGSRPCRASGSSIHIRGTPRWTEVRDEESGPDDDWDDE
jgi:hypothetical protein